MQILSFCNRILIYFYYNQHQTKIIAFYLAVLVHTCSSSNLLVASISSNNLGQNITRIIGCLYFFTFGFFKLSCSVFRVKFEPLFFRGFGVDFLVLVYTFGLDNKFANYEWVNATWCCHVKFHKILVYPMSIVTRFFLLSW